MPSYLSPGVYTRETDFSFYIKQISTSACGMIGIAEKGPINKPTLVTSWEQFVRKFGSYIPDGYLAYAARAFFDNGGQVLYVNRVEHYDWPTDPDSIMAIKAVTTLMDREGVAASLTTGTTGTNRITWRAKNIGSLGNNIQVAVIKSGNNTPLSVSVSGQTITVNLATDASGNATSTCSQVVTAVNNNASASTLIQATHIDYGIVGPFAATPLTGGQNARPSVNVFALSEGAWGNSLKIEITDSTVDPANLFNLTVRHKDEVVESFRDLSMDVTHPSYVETAINERSEYITVEDCEMPTTPALRRPLVGGFAMSYGEDGTDNMQDEDYIGDQAARTGLYAFDGNESLNLLLVPGVTSATVIHAGIAYAESRRDILFIAEAPLFVNPLEAVDFRKGKGMFSHAAFNSSYAALYYPWIEISDPLTGKKKLVPPTGAVAGCIARSDEKAEVWCAPAGIDRGRVFNALSLAYKTSRGERDVLYPEGINVIASFPDTGINIWGQRMLQSQPSATDRINVRRLMMYIEEAISQSSRFVVFEPNNRETWRALVRLITPFLQNIKSKGGFYDFRVQCNEESNPPAVIDRNEMVCRVFVKPTKTAEFVELNFILTATGASFREIL